MHACNARHHLSTPFSAADQANLEELLDKHSGRSIDVVLGLLTAVAVAPVIVSPSVWMNVVMPPPAMEHEADALRVIKLALRLYNEVVAAVHDHAPLLPPAEDAPALERFAEGFCLGVDLDESWTRDADHLELVGPFALLCGREDLVPREMLWALDADPCMAELIREQLDVFVVMAEESFSGSRTQCSPAPGPARAERKVGRNGKCACGSGKKFKKCCLV